MGDVKASVRIARLDDVDRITELTGQLGYDVETAAVRERLARMLQRQDHRFLVAELDGRVVGWLHAVVSDYIETGPFVVVAGLVVDKSVRQGGIGRSLMSAAEQWAVEQGCQVVRLWSSAARTKAHRFYERLGYAHVKTQYSFVKSVDPSGRHDFAGFIPRIGPGERKP